MNPEHMRRAIALSREAVATGLGGPFGAVIVRDDIVVAEASIGCVPRWTPQPMRKW